MELKTLEFFLAAAREENITKAAALLHVTQPTLSRQLIQLAPELDRAIAALAESFSAGEPDLKTALNRRKRNMENVVPGTKISGDESAEPYRDLLELVRLLKKLDSSPLLPENFRNWRRNMLQRLLETQQRDGSWGNVPSTFYALCCLRLIL